MRAEVGKFRKNHGQKNRTLIKVCSLYDVEQMREDDFAECFMVLALAHVLFPYLEAFLWIQNVLRSMFCHVCEAPFIPTEAHGWWMWLQREDESQVTAQHTHTHTHTHTHACALPHANRSPKKALLNKHKVAYTQTQVCSSTVRTVNTHSSECLSWPSTSSVVHHTQVASLCSLAD